MSKIFSAPSDGLGMGCRAIVIKVRCAIEELASYRYTNQSQSLKNVTRFDKLFFSIRLVASKINCQRRIIKFRFYTTLAVFTLNTHMLLTVLVLFDRAASL